MKITLKSIAKEAGVSEATASLALNNRPGVKFATKKRILELAEHYGYTPSQSAIQLNGKKSGTIGLLVPNLYNLFYSQIVQELETYLHGIGFRMIFATTDNDPAREKEMIKSFISFDVDGVILYPLIRDNHEPDYLSLLVKNNIPFVFIGGHYTNYDVPYCMSDLYSGISELIDLMYRGGSRNFLYFGSCRFIVSNQVKIQALEEKLAEKSVLFRPDSDYIYLKRTNFDYAYEETKRLIQQGRAFDAAIAGDAYSCFGIYQALRESGKSVPEDVVLGHFDNMLKPSICVMRMTCIEQNIKEMVKGTVDLLTRLMDNQSTEPCRLIPTRLIVRNSTRQV